ncbi:unnamed protein product, partial [marine sediment metagenome]
GLLRDSLRLVRGGVWFLWCSGGDIERHDTLGRPDAPGEDL